MELFWLLFWLLSTIVVILFVMLKIKEYQLNILEQHIQTLFIERTWILPSFFEVSKSFLTKHDDIFKELLLLRKQEFSEEWLWYTLFKSYPTKKLIHHEINFIFRICNKHPKLIKAWKFIYLRNLLMEKSSHIGSNISEYKQLVKVFNKLVSIKNKTIIWLFLPLRKKIEL